MNVLSQICGQSAGLARAVALAIALVHLPHYSIPQPIPYRSADHVEPTRRGVPANIPIFPEGWTLEYRGRLPRGISMP